MNDSYHERDFRSGWRPGIVEPADGETVPMTESTADLTVDPCPLCGCRSSIVVDSIPYASIWAELERQLGLTTPAELRRRFTPAPDASLFACSTCGLEYFSPHNQGDAAFYAFLTSAEAGYYTNRRWEYSVAEKLLHSGDSLLDIGCGDGAFLKQVARRVGRAVGVDQNPEGIRDLAEAGIEARCTDLAAFAAENAAGFNVVCAFQLLEHLPRVDAFAEAARRCVAPGGLLLVSVPNNDRPRLNPLDPLDCPPHHVSRWRPAQLREFARAFQFDLVDVISERRSPGALPGILRSLGRRTSAFRHRSAVTSADAHEGRPEPRARSRRPTLSTRHLRNLMLGHTMILVARRPA
jgi:2-polyprenyl-3-methyl-5-hydroxy-6-metoxy-1,4-benzoquinol methylase